MPRFNTARQNGSLAVQIVAQDGDAQRTIVVTPFGQPALGGIQVGLSEGSPPPLAFKNRACHFSGNTAPQLTGFLSWSTYPLGEFMVSPCIWS